jgi:hypothetical protein
MIIYRYLLAILIALSLTAWAQEEEPRHGGTLNYIVSAEPPSFDAHRETTFAMLHPIRPHYNLLIKFDLANYPEVVGDLAESWEVSEDGLSYTFTVRDDVRFHDGSPLTARDVAFTVERVPTIRFSPASYAEAVKEIEAVEVVDDHTIRFRTRTPFPLFTNEISRLYIVSHAAAAGFPVGLLLHRSRSSVARQSRLRNGVCQGTAILREDNCGDSNYCRKAIVAAAPAMKAAAVRLSALSARGAASRLRALAARTR